MSYETTTTYIKTNWQSSTWTEYSNIYCERIVSKSGPSYSTASFLIEYGSIKNSQAEYVQSPLSLNDCFVQVRLNRSDGTQKELFTGIIQVNSNAIAGKILTGQGLVETGNQLLTAYDMTYVLDRVIVSNTFVLNEDSSMVYQISHVPTMNNEANNGGQIIGNRSLYPDSSGRYRYGIDGEVWSHYEYLRTIFYDNTPAISISSSMFELVGQIEELDKIRTIQEVEGLTVREILNKLVNIKNGFGWTVLPVGDSPVVSIRVYTVTPKDISVGSTTIRANDVITDVTLVNSDSNFNIRITDDVKSKWDYIEVLGEKILACFTVQGNSLTPQWTPEQEVQYEEAGKNTAGYYSLSEELQTSMNDRFRSTDQMRNVYQALSFPDNWNWTVDGIPLNVSVDSNGNLNTSRLSGYYNSDKVLSSFLPLLDDNGECRKAFSVIYVEGAYHYLDRIGESLFDEDDRPYPSVGLEMSKYNLGIQHLARPNHIIAYGEYDETEPSSYEPRYYYGDIYSTLAVRTDQRLKVSVMLNPNGYKTLRIYVPNMELWYAIKGTVIDINTDGTMELVQPASGNYEILRNDNAMLQSIAAAAKAWYGRTQRVLEYSLQTMDSPAYPGIMLSNATVNGDTIKLNTIITQVIYDCRQRTSTISTDFDGVDFNAILNMTLTNASNRNIGNQIKALKESMPSTVARDYSSGGSGVGISDLIYVQALEQPQSDGKMSVKKVMPTLSATNNLSAFDMYMFGDKGSCTLSALANTYGLSSFTLFNSATGAGTLMVAGAVKDYATGIYDYVSVQPVFIRTAPCEEPAE